jgi:hypothetical protein
MTPALTAPRRVSWAAACAAWLVFTAIGMHLVWKYKATAGAADASPATWPPASAIVRATGRATLLLFAHPHCPCTRASLGELAWLVERFADRVDAHVLVLRPAGTAPGWEAGDNEALAAAIPGVRVAVDEAGREAARFGAATSGHTFLYAAGGRLLYSGGITGARGHPGDNLGRARVASLLERGTADRADGPVFGCALSDPGSEPAKELSWP